MDRVLRASDAFTDGYEVRARSTPALGWSVSCSWPPNTIARSASRLRRCNISISSGVKRSEYGVSRRCFHPKKHVTAPECVFRNRRILRSHFLPVRPEQEIQHAQWGAGVHLGKSRQELQVERSKRGDNTTAIVFLEQLYPFPEAELEENLPTLLDERNCLGAGRTRQHGGTCLRRAATQANRHGLSRTVGKAFSLRQSGDGFSQSTCT